MPLALENIISWVDILQSGLINKVLDIFSLRQISDKHMRWANMLSTYHFQIVPTPRTQNKVADALSRKPQISNVTIAYHQDLAGMREHYAADSNFKEIWQQMQDGQSSSQYSGKDGYLMKDDYIRITQERRSKDFR